MKSNALRILLGICVITAMALPAMAEEEAAPNIQFSNIPFGARIIYEVDGETIEEPIVEGKSYPANSRVVFKNRGKIMVSVDGRDGSTMIMGDRFAAFELGESSVLGGVKVKPVAGDVKIVSGDGASEEILTAGNDTGTTGDQQEGNPIRRAPGVPTTTEQSAPVFIPAPTVTPPPTDDPDDTPPDYN